MCASGTFGQFEDEQYLYLKFLFLDYENIKINSKRTLHAGTAYSKCI